MKKIAHFISNVIQPLLIPTYSMLLLFQVGNFQHFAFRYKAFTIFSMFILTAIIPLVGILVLKRMGVVSSIQLPVRKERTIPYIFVVFAYVAAIIFLYRIYMPTYIVSMSLGVLVSTVLIMLVNLKWKISAHLSGVGGLSAAILVVGIHLKINVSFLLGIMFILSGMLATSRIIIKAHTLMQTIAGFVVGFIIILMFGLL